MPFSSLLLTSMKRLWMGALPARSLPARWAGMCLLSLLAAGSAADVSNPIAIAGDQAQSAAPNGYLARIQKDSPEDIERALRRAEQLFLDGRIDPESGPLAFVIHGPEAAIFFKDSYPAYKAIVDLAARLTAFEVIQVKVCETRMGVLGRKKTELVPFVETVPFGPAEVNRLVNTEEYVYF
ncbi:acyl-CoA transferase [Exilibacterium tricleocarpae]|uniref:Acyl-CoA transferase n=1 Tax=Exilibacterium tricleocarpae TaxID=2591008 RepID=A0A545T3A9_9GAMM|nr:acyl-CoA transferase [Exilibacterium tricleocarpae]TQV71704.1 acyl-CoA transferase [Exilibacterium tricleocarpae]